MKRVLILLVAGTVMSGVAAAYATSARSATKPLPAANPTVQPPRSE